MQSGIPRRALGESDSTGITYIVPRRRVASRSGGAPIPLRGADLFSGWPDDPPGAIIDDTSAFPVPNPCERRGLFQAKAEMRFAGLQETSSGACECLAARNVNQGDFGLWSIVAFAADRKRPRAQSRHHFCKREMRA
jgi:hypothetical protein